MVDQTAQDLVIHNETDKQVDVAEALVKVVLLEQDLEILEELPIPHLQQMVGVMMADQIPMETLLVEEAVLEVLVVKEQQHNQVVLEETEYHLVLVEQILPMLVVGEVLGGIAALVLMVVQVVEDLAVNSLVEMEIMEPPLLVVEEVVLLVEPQVVVDQVLLSFPIQTHKQPIT